MTTDKQIVDSLTAQGKTVSQEEAPPQTIIGTFPTLDSVLQAAIRARDRVGAGAGLHKLIMRKFGSKVADIPQHRWQEAGEWFDSIIIPAAVDGGAEGIIRVCETTCRPKFNEVLNFGHAPIIPTAVDGGAEGIIPFKVALDEHFVDPISDMWRKQLFESEIRRQTVQAEAMVNLAVGVTLMTLGGLNDMTGQPIANRVHIRPKDLEAFQSKYTVTQEVQPDGGFIVSVTPKEV